MFDLFRKLTWAFDHFRNTNPRKADGIIIALAVGVCLFMLVSQIRKVIGG